MKPVERYVFFINPLARDGRTLDRLRMILARRPDIAIRSRQIVGNDEKPMVRELERMGPGDLPVAVGGDGTINWMVRILRKLGQGTRPIAVLPLGIHGLL